MKIKVGDKVKIRKLTFEEYKKTSYVKYGFDSEKDYKEIYLSGMKKYFGKVGIILKKHKYPFYRFHEDTFLIHFLDGKSAAFNKVNLEKIL